MAKHGIRADFGDVGTGENVRRALDEVQGTLHQWRDTATGGSPLSDSIRNVSLRVAQAQREAESLVNRIRRTARGGR